MKRVKGASMLGAEEWDLSTYLNFHHLPPSASGDHQFVLCPLSSVCGGGWFVCNEMFQYSECG